MRRSAFTLIELLVVIAIIAILASIALPVFNSATERARAATDAANLKNLGVGITAYLNDNDDEFFPSGTAAWPVVLQKKYVPDWKVFRSPFDRETAARPKKETAPGVPVSYGLNRNLVGTSASRFEAPSELVLAAPVPEQGGSSDLTFRGTSESPVDLTRPTGTEKRGTHSKRNMINVLFADTHVSAMTWADFSSTSGEAARRRWEPEGN